MTPHMCTEMFSLENGKDSSEDYLCVSGRQFESKCASTQTSDSTCIKNSEDRDYGKCKISYNTTDGDNQSGYVDCIGYGDSQYCPLQSDSQ